MQRGRWLYYSLKLLVFLLQLCLHLPQTLLKVSVAFLSLHKQGGREMKEKGDGDGDERIGRERDRGGKIEKFKGNGEERVRVGERERWRERERERERERQREKMIRQRWTKGDGTVSY